MNNLILIVFSLISITGYAQSNPTTHPTDYGWNERFGFMIGIGASSLINTTYENAAVEKMNKTVVIENAGKIRSNVTLGIVFTPYPVTTKRTIETMENGSQKTIIDYKYYPKGISFALFINPINVTSISKTTFNSTDFGAGIGWRTGDFAFLATLELTSLRQPREYFIKEYMNNKLQYKVDNNIQSAIDINDDSIYRNIVRPAIGFKIAYTISLFKNYGSAVQ